jgi:uncharacterized protein with HEPN domain
MKTKRTIPQRLGDIQDAIASIRKYAKDSQDIHDHDELIRIWVTHYLYILGEATRAIASDFPSFRDQHPEIKWREIINMRTFLAHEYFRVDLGILWPTLKWDLNELKNSIDIIQEKGVA